MQARDSALHNGNPSGIRLLPDPAFPLVFNNPNFPGQVDPSQPLAANRVIPIETAPEYSEGQLAPAFPVVLNVPYPVGTQPVYYPVANNSSSNGPNVLMVKEIVVNTNGASERAYFLVLEHPGGRQATDQWRGALVHGGGADGDRSCWRQLGDVRERRGRRGRSRCFPNFSQGELRCRPSSCSWSTGLTTTRTVGSTRGGTGSTTITARSLRTAART